MIIIELSTAETTPQYARKPFFAPVNYTDARIPTTYIKRDAKQFKTVKQAHAWLARRGFMKRTREVLCSSGYRSLGCNENYPEPFLGFELLALDTTE